MECKRGIQWGNWYQETKNHQENKIDKLTIACVVLCHDQKQGIRSGRPADRFC
jgi:hypothetical protein